MDEALDDLLKRYFPTESSTAPLQVEKNTATTADAPSLVDPQPIVKIHVKSNDSTVQTFMVHKNFICYYSSFFNAAFNGIFAEGETQEMDFQDTNLIVFGVFVNWLYTQKIVLNDHSTPDCAILMSLWILADRILCPKLQNKAIQQLDIQRVAQKRIPAKEFTYVYENTVTNSPLRRYIVDTRDYSRIQNPQNYPQELLVGLVNMLCTDLEKGPQGPRKRIKPRHTVGLLEDYELIKYYVDESAGQVSQQGASEGQPMADSTHRKLIKSSDISRKRRRTGSDRGPF